MKTPLDLLGEVCACIRQQVRRLEADLEKAQAAWAEANNILMVAYEYAPPELMERIERFKREHGAPGMPASLRRKGADHG